MLSEQLDNFSNAFEAIKEQVNDFGFKIINTTLDTGLVKFQLYKIDELSRDDTIAKFNKLASYLGCIAEPAHGSCVHCSDDFICSYYSNGYVFKFFILL